MLSDHFRALERLALDCEDEAWRMSQRPLARGTTAFVSETLRDAGVLGEAMRRIARAYDVIHAGSFNRVERRSDRVVYHIDDDRFPFDPGLTGDDATTMMETVLIFVHSMLSLVAGRDLGPHLRCVRVRRPARPADDGPLDFWPAPLRFGASSYQLEYAPAMAALPVGQPFRSFGAVEVWAQAIRMAELRDQSLLGSVADRVRAAIADGAKDQAEVAHRLGVSVATLRRRLDGAGRSFRELRAEILNREARGMLERRCEAADVAQRLGFADLRSFARAFKSWNGVTPAAYAGLIAAD